MICFGILGAGRIGKVHARTIAAAAGARVAAIADAVPEAAATLAREVGAVTATVEDILAHRGIDAVLIASPTPTHADLIERAAAAGKAILCEKPVSLSVDRISECLAVVEKRRTPLMIGFNRRFDPNFAALEGRVRAVLMRQTQGGAVTASMSAVNFASWFSVPPARTALASPTAMTATRSAVVVLALLLMAQHGHSQ